MTTSCTLQERRHSLLGEADGRLVLRVLAGEHAGKVLHLRSPKCTIGSDPHATLRLRADGVWPVHCQILRGEQGTFVRRWSPGTLLNGSGFEFRRLKTGDQLDIGHVELEVLEPTPLEPEVELEPTDSRSSRNLAEACQSDPQTAEQQAVIQGLRDELSQKHVQLAEAESRQAELNKAIVAANRRADGLECQFAELETRARGKTAQADDAALRYECHVEELNDELAVAQLRLSDWQREPNESTERHREEIEESPKEHRRVRDEWHADLESMRRELADRAESLQKKESEHNELMNEAEHLIRSLQHEGKQLLAQLAEAKQTIRQNAEDRKSLESATIPFGNRVECSMPKTTSADSSPAAVQPTVVIPTNNSANGSPPSSPTIGKIVKDADDEAYIQDYMQRLLKQDGTAAPRNSAASEPDEIIASEMDKSPQESDGREVAPVSKNGSTDGVLPVQQAAAGLVVAPEATNIDALRELANSSTRSAINTSQRRQNIVAAIGQMGVAMTSSICGLVAIALSQELISGPAIAGTIGLAFGLNRAWRVVKLLRARR